MNVRTGSRPQEVTSFFEKVADDMRFGNGGSNDSAGTCALMTRRGTVLRTSLSALVVWLIAFVPVNASSFGPPEQEGSDQTEQVDKDGQKKKSTPRSSRTRKQSTKRGTGRSSRTPAKRPSSRSGNDEKGQPTPARNRRTTKSTDRGASSSRETQTEKLESAVREDIPPIDSDIPPEEKTYYFSCSDCTYKQLVAGFARQTGLGVLGDAPKGGKVNFVTTERLSFDQALARVRMLLFNYKPHEPYWMDREDTHLSVSRVTDIPRILPLNRWFRSLEELWAAKLADDELALVIHTPESGSIAALRQVRDFLPDYVRWTPLEGQNSVTIFALVKDIRKYVDLIDLIRGGTKDPRVIKRIELQHILPSEAMSQLQTLMSGRGGDTGPTPRPRSTTRGRAGAKEPSALDTVKAPGLTMMPFDEQKILLVQAMPGKLDEIQKLLPFIDVDISEDESGIVVIPIEHADALRLADTIRSIIDAMENPGAAVGKPKRSTSRRSKAATMPTLVKAGGMTLMSHPSKNALIVIGSDESVARVRELVNRFDVESEVGPISIAVHNVAASRLIPRVTEVLGTAPSPGKVPATQFQLLTNPTDDALWYMGPERELARVKEIVAMLDVSGVTTTLHVVELVHQTPTFVASILRELAADAGKPAGPKAGVKRGGKSVVVSKFTANDEQNRLYAFCTDAEWNEYLVVINQLEAEMGETRPFDRVHVKSIDPQDAIDQLIALQSSEWTASGVRFAPTDGALLVFGASRRILQEIEAVLAEIDRIGVKVEQRTFLIQHGDPDAIKTAIETLVGGEQGARNTPARKRAGKKGGARAVGSVLPELTIFQFDNRLVVRATPETMAEVEKVISEFDVDDSGTVMKVYDDFPRGCDVEELSDTLAGMLGEPGKPRGKSQGHVRTLALDGGAKFIPQVGFNRLVVIASPNEFPKIEEYMDVLRLAVSSPVTITEFIELTHAEPNVMIEMISPLLSLRAEQLVADGLLQGEPGRQGARPKKGLPKKGQAGISHEHFHIQADSLQQRIIMVAPQVMVDAAKELIERLDQPSGGDAVFRTVDLQNSSADDMVRSIREMMGAQRRPVRRGKDKAAKPEQTFDASTLSVVAAPGGSAVILHGPSVAVEEATRYINHLDGIKTGGREIKIFKIKQADIFDLGDLIVNVIDTPSLGGKPKRQRLSVPTVEDDFEFELTKTWTGQDLYMKGDRVAYTLLVAALPQKLAKIEELVNRFDEGEDSVSKAPIPKFLYELKHRTAMDASLDLDLLLQAIWDDDEKPTVEYLPFGETLVIRYPREDRFDKIREYIREHIDKPGAGPKTKKKGIMALPGTTAMDTALMLKMANPHLNITIIDDTRIKDTEWDVERLGPRKSNSSGCVMPLAFYSMARDMSVVALGQSDPEPETGEKSDTDPLAKAVEALLLQDGEPKDRSESPADDALTIRVDNETGEIIIEGLETLIDEVPTWIEELKEEMEDVNLPPDIRIYRVRHIPVYMAAEILGEMFNATRQQRQAVQQQQRAQQARLRQQQQQARRQQQQARGQGDQPQRGQQRGRQQQQPTTNVAQLPPTSVRIYPNPRDRTLILRAEANQFPAILELLATIDQPQPINSKMRVFKLEKLNAADVEALLTEMLGLGGSGARRGRGSGSRAAGGAAAQRGRAQTSRRTQVDGDYLPETLMQDMVAGTGTGQLGVDAKDIKLSSNEETNTIIVLAPQVAIDFVGEIIKQLESEEIPERVSKYYDLVYASPANVVEQLEAKFGSTGGKSRPGKGGAGPSGGGLNTPTFVPYPRLNLITAIATAKQIEEIDDIIARLDVAGDEHDWEYVPLDHSDAKTVADTLTQMFGGGGAVTSGSSRRGAGGPEAGPQFIGDDGGRILLFSAAEHMHQPIRDAIAKLEAEAAETMKLHVITLTYAKPSDVATAIEKAYGSSGGRRGTSRQSSGVQFTLTPHDPTNRLFVRADESFFAEVAGLAKSLDEPRSVAFEFRVYPLQFADAMEVHEQMTKLMTDYLKLLSPEERGNMDAFSVDVNERANALVVLGNPLIFGFLEENLPKIDNPAVKVEKPSVMMTVLKTADAREVAANITQLWTQKNTKSKEKPPIVQANPSLNMLIVRGTPEQLEEIKNEFIDPMELESPLSLQMETINLVHADAGAVADSINQIFEDKKQAMQGAKVGPSQSPLTFTVVVTPVVSTRQVIVQASAENMEIIKARIAELDQEEIATRIKPYMQIYRVSYADTATVAKIINEWGKSKTQNQGRNKSGGAQDMVNAVAEPATKTVVVMATKANHVIVQELIDGLDDEKVAAIGEVVRVVPVLYGDAGEMQTAIQEYLRKPSGSGGKGAELAGDMRLSVLSQSNALVISGTQEEVDRIEKTILQLDKASEEGGAPQIIRLKHAQAGDIAPTLQDMFTGQTTGARGRTQTVIIANPAANTLIVKAEPRDLSAIRALAEQLDTEEEQPANFRLVQVAPGVSVVDLGMKVEQTINESSRARRGRGGRGSRGSSGGGTRMRQTATITLTPDTRTNSLIMAGSPTLFDDAEKLIRAMEEMGPPGGRGIRMLKLNRVPAREIQQLIDRLRGPDARSSQGRRGSSSRRGSSTGQRSGSRSSSQQQRKRRP